MRLAPLQCGASARTQDTPVIYPSQSPPYSPLPQVAATPAQPHQALRQAPYSSPLPVGGPPGVQSPFTWQPSAQLQATLLSSALSQAITARTVMLQAAAALATAGPPVPLAQRAPQLAAGTPHPLTPTGLPGPQPAPLPTDPSARPLARRAKVRKKAASSAQGAPRDEQPPPDKRPRSGTPAAPPPRRTESTTAPAIPAGIHSENSDDEGTTETWMTPFAPGEAVDVDELAKAFQGPHERRFGELVDAIVDADSLHELPELGVMSHLAHASPDLRKCLFAALCAHSCRGLTRLIRALSTVTDRPALTDVLDVLAGLANQDTHCQSALLRRLAVNDRAGAIALAVALQHDNLRVVETATILANLLMRGALPACRPLRAALTQPRVLQAIAQGTLATYGTIATHARSLLWRLMRRTSPEDAPIDAVLLDVRVRPRAIASPPEGFALVTAWVSTCVAHQHVRHGSLYALLIQMASASPQGRAAVAQAMLDDSHRAATAARRDGKAGRTAGSLLGLLAGEVAQVGSTTDSFAAAADAMSLLTQLAGAHPVGRGAVVSAMSTKALQGLLGVVFALPDRADASLWRGGLRLLVQLLRASPDTTAPLMAALKEDPGFTHVLAMLVNWSQQAHDPPAAALATAALAALRPQLYALDAGASGAMLDAALLRSDASGTRLLDILIARVTRGQGNSQTSALALLAEVATHPHNRPAIRAALASGGVERILAILATSEQGSDVEAGTRLLARLALEPEAGATATFAQLTGLLRQRSMHWTNALAEAAVAWSDDAPTAQALLRFLLRCVKNRPADKGYLLMALGRHLMAELEADTPADDVDAFLAQGGKASTAEAAPTADGGSAAAASTSSSSSSSSVMGVAYSRQA